MYNFSMIGRRMAAYTCRSCGLEIVNKGAFWKCPRCGIKYDSPN